MIEYFVFDASRSYTDTLAYHKKGDDTLGELQDHLDYLNEFGGTPDCFDSFEDFKSAINEGERLCGKLVPYVQITDFQFTPIYEICLNQTTGMIETNKL